MDRTTTFLPLIAALGLLLGTTACTNDQHTATMNTEKTTSLFPMGNKAADSLFTGDAFVQPLVRRDRNNDYVAGAVTFEPGARTNWHTHPKGQVLIVTEGEGWYQERDKPAQRIRRSDVVVVPENTEHWHGASADSRLVHIAITNYFGDVNATWLKPVTDVEYAGAEQ